MIAVSFALFALEAKFASHGVLTTGGIVLLTLGGLLLVDAPIPEMRVRLLTALAVSIPLGVITVFLMTIALRARRNKVVTGVQGMIGEIGVAQSTARPRREGFRAWRDLECDFSSAPVPIGSKVVVRRVDGLQLEVDPACRPNISAIPLQARFCNGACTYPYNTWARSYDRRIPQLIAVQSASDTVYIPERRRRSYDFPAVGIAVIIFVIYLLSSIKILAEYERGVIFRLGRLLSQAKGPGIILVFAPIDRIVRVSLRQEAFEVAAAGHHHARQRHPESQRRHLPARDRPHKAVVEVSNYVYQTSQFAQTTLRSVLGEAGTRRTARPSRQDQPAPAKHSRQHTAPWGVKVANVEVKQVDMPESMLRAMAKQAEAEREKRSKIIHAEGEFAAAQRLVDAAHVLATEPVSVQLRYLQTLTEIGVEKNTTVVFPVPVDFFSGLQKVLGGGTDTTPAKAG